MIARDERQFFSCGWYLVADPTRPASWNFDEPGYELLKFLQKPRSSKEIEEYRTGLAADNPLREPERMAHILQMLGKMGAIVQTTAEAPAAKQAFSPTRKTEWRYIPASGPISAEVELPMDPNRLRDLLGQLDGMGLLGLDFSYEKGSEAALKAVQESLREVRAAVSIRLRAEDLTEAGGEVFATLKNVGGRPVLVMVEVEEEVAAIGAAGKILREKQVPFCVAFRAGPRSSSEMLKEAASEALASGAGFIIFVLCPQDKDGTEAMDFETLQARLTDIRLIQANYPSGKVQATAEHMPLEAPAVGLEKNLRSLFMRYLGGCSAGALRFFTPNKGPQERAPVPEVPGPEYAGSVGVDLPPNCCQGGITHLAVDKEGKVYPCAAAIGNDEHAMGSVSESKLAEIWESEKWEFFRGGWDLYQLSGCYGCKRYISCVARCCRIYPEKELGNRLAPMPLCLKSAEIFELKEENIATVVGEEQRGVLAATKRESAEG